MTARLRQPHSEDGFTLVEVLIASVLMLIVLGATLTALTSYQRNTQTNQRQNDGQDEARRTLDLVARDLRNLASPVVERPEAVDRKEPQDLIVQSEGKGSGGSSNARNTMRVRFCLSPDGKVYRSIQTWTTAAIPNAPAATDCPGTGWTSSTVIAQNVVNGARPLFTYNAVGLQDVTEVSTSLYVDVNPGKPPAETELQSSVYLRNQNRKPEALFSIEVVNNSILMNASESTDPEEKALIYSWTLDGTAVGNGILFTKPVTAGTHTVRLDISDGVLTDDETHTICVPAPAQGVNC
jgi:prepilin-type N-terminal cleavage/methylation domain-containing protein